MSEAQTSKLRQGVIKINVADQTELYQIFMPFIDGCGVFYATEESFKMGQEVFVFLQLPDNLGKFAVSGRIVWLNPPKKVARRVPGVGVQLSGKDVPKIRELIEGHLGKRLLSGLPSYTL